MCENGSGKLGDENNNNKRQEDKKITVIEREKN